MVIKTPAELGIALKDRRRRLSLSQAELARRVGVSRHWVIDAERGSGAAELGLVLRAVRALNLIVDLSNEAHAAGRNRTTQVDIDAVVRRAKEEPK